MGYDVPCLGPSSLAQHGMDIFHVVPCRACRAEAQVGKLGCAVWAH